MGKSKYTEGQFIGFLRQFEAGMPVKDLCRKHGFSDASFYKWRAMALWRGIVMTITMSFS